MKSSRLYILLALILSVAAIVFVYSFERKAQDLEPKQIPIKTAEVINQKSDSIPLLVLGSFMNLREEISKQELINGIKTGVILCTADLIDYLKLSFELENNPKAIVLDAFDFKNQSGLIVTTIDSVDSRFLSLKVDSISYFKNPADYSLWKEIEHGSFSYNKDITRYNHTGVTALTRSTGVTLDEKGIDFYLANISPYFRDAELVHVSNEVSLVDTCVYASMRLKFATKRKHFEVLKRLNVNLVELTGNHNLDVGKDAYLNTLDWYKNNNINYFGGGSTASEANAPLIIELKDKSRVAWIGFNERCPLRECADDKPGANRYQDEKAESLIDSLKNLLKVDYVIACVQFGEIDSYSPRDNQKYICKKLIDYGADVIIGSQAHQAQEIALYKGKVIFYGLGNFLFDQIHRIGVRQAFFLECYFYKGKVIQFQPVYTFMNRHRQPTIANAEQKLQIQNAILKESNF